MPIQNHDGGLTGYAVKVENTMRNIFKASVGWEGEFL
jgi:hypothetical protein